MDLRHRPLAACRVTIHQLSLPIYRMTRQYTCTGTTSNYVAIWINTEYAFIYPDSRSIGVVPIQMNLKIFTLHSSAL